MSSERDTSEAEGLKSDFGGLAQRALAKMAANPPPAQARRAQPDFVSMVLFSIGRRYRDATLENFELADPETAKPADLARVSVERERQEKALARLREFCADLGARIEAGDGLLLYGPSGTGKDHLLSAVLKQAAGIGKECRYFLGDELYSFLKEGFEVNRESSRIRELQVVPVLALSDPVLADAEISNYCRLALGRILWVRYKELRPTWVAVNGNDSKEIAALMGTAVADRVWDCALRLHCNWESKRKERAR